MKLSDSSPTSKIRRKNSRSRHLPENRVTWRLTTGGRLWSGGPYTPISQSEQKHDCEPRATDDKVKNSQLTARTCGIQDRLLRYSLAASMQVIRLSANDSFQEVIRDVYWVFFKWQCTDQSIEWHRFENYVRLFGCNSLGNYVCLEADDTKQTRIIGCIDCTDHYCFLPISAQICESKGLGTIDRGNMNSCSSSVWHRTNF